jgi:hypothetical protein
MFSGSLIIGVLFRTLENYTIYDEVKLTRDRNSD